MMKAHACWVCSVCLLAAPTAARAQDMPLSQVIKEGEGWQPVGPRFKEVSSLAADAMGNVYVASGKRIVRLDADGKATDFAESEAPTSSLFFVADGRLLAMQPEANRVVSFDKQGKESPLFSNVNGHDLAVTRSGNVYFSVPAGHALFLLRLGKKEQVDEGVAAPAGMTLWPDGGTLVVGDRAGKHLYAYRIDKAGKLNAREGYYTLRTPPGQKSAGIGPLTVDSTGRLYATSTLGIQIFDTTGRMSGVVLQPVLAPATAVAFGGPARDRLYAAFGGQVYQRLTKVKGVSPAGAAKD